MDQTQGMGQGQDTSAQAPQSQPVTAPVESVKAPSSEERTFKQSEVNALISRVKNETLESYRRMQQEQPKYLEQKFEERGLSPRSEQSYLNESSDDRIRRLAAEEAQRHVERVRQDALQKSQEEMAQRTVQNFWNKVLPGREKYQDFDAITGNIEFAKFPNVVQLLGDYVENSSDLLYELGKDRQKLVTLEMTAREFPNEAIAMAKRLSQSLKDNEAATKVKLPNEPLSQLRPSNTGTDSGAMSVSDYRKKYRA